MGRITKVINQRKWEWLLIFFLSVISFVLSAVAFTNVSVFKTQINSVKKMLAYNTEELFIINVSFIENEDSAGVDLAEIKKYINSLEGCTCGAYDESSEKFLELVSNRNFLDFNRYAYKGTLMQEHPENVNVIFVDPIMLEMLNFPLKNDDLQNKESVDEYLPIYVGSDFEGIIELGDTLTLTRSNAIYRVEGFLRDVHWLNDSDVVTLPTESLNHKFLAPFSVFDSTDTMSQLSTVGKILINTKDSNVANQINEFALDKGIKIRIVCLQDYIEQWSQDNEEIIMMNIYFAVIVVLCSAISIISTKCVSILLKKKEYGICLSFGKTQRGIVMNWIIEIFLLQILAAFIAFFYQKNIYSECYYGIFAEIYKEALCRYTLPGIVIEMFVLSAIILIIPGMILFRYSPANLIKEEEL